MKLLEQESPDFKRWYVNQIKEFIINDYPEENYEELDKACHFKCPCDFLDLICKELLKLITRIDPAGEAFPDLINDLQVEFECDIENKKSLKKKLNTIDKKIIMYSLYKDMIYISLTFSEIVDLYEYAKKNNDIDDEGYLLDYDERKTATEIHEDFIAHKDENDDDISSEDSLFSDIYQSEVIDNETFDNYISNNSPYIKNFIKKNKLGDECSFIFLYVSVNKDFLSDDYGTTDKELKKGLEKLEKNLTDNNVPVEAVYYSGAPQGVTAIDYLSIIHKTFGLLKKSADIGQAGMALFSLSNPLSAGLTLASFGIDILENQAKNKIYEERKTKVALLQKNLDLLYMAKEKAIESGIWHGKFMLIANKLDPSRDCADDYYALDGMVLSVLDALEKEIDDVEANIMYQKVPTFINMKRVKKICKNEQIIQYIESCYHGEKYKAPFCILDYMSSSELSKLEILLNQIGYFSVSSLVKSVL